MVDVPEMGMPGDTVLFLGRNGEELHAVIPPGCKPGDKFKVVPPVVMVQVPKGARGGRNVSIKLPNDKERQIVRVPEGCAPGTYFCVPLVLRSQEETHTRHPKSIKKDSRKVQRKNNKGIHRKFSDGL